MNANMIRVSDATHERLRKLVYELHLSHSKVIDTLLDTYAENTAPLTFAVSAVTDDGADEEIQA